jgi:hypothetical protein
VRVRGALVLLGVLAIAADVFNQSTVGTTDGVGCFAGSLSRHVGASLLAGGHHQSKNDIDDDGWYDLAG